jgi:hypothetical protein
MLAMSTCKNAMLMTDALGAMGQSHALAVNIVLFSGSYSPQIDKPTLHLESFVH